MIKVCFLLSYDYAFVKYSLPCVYPYADSITFSIDRNRTSWSGNQYKFDESIIDWIKAYDTEQKIRIYEDDFYVPGKTAMENDTRQRNKTAEFMGKGGWHLQIDSDEYFINFKGFVDFLKSKSHYLNQPEKNKVVVAANWINLIKFDKDGFFYVNEANATPVRVATNYPEYHEARLVLHRVIYTPFIMLHQSYARDEAEIYFKFKNWGHSQDFDTEAYFNFWKSINKDNYTSIRNFNPVAPHDNWKSLGYIPCQNVNELIVNFDQLNFSIPRWPIVKKNVIQFFLRNKLLFALYHKIIFKK